MKFREIPICENHHDKYGILLAVRMICATHLLPGFISSTFFSKLVGPRMASLEDGIL
jgi:hypothetical protein